MTPQTPAKTVLRHSLEVASLARYTGERHIDLVPDADELAALSGQLGASILRKVSLKGQLEPVGKRDWLLTARLGATIIQPCVATLAPVTTRVEEDVVRLWQAEIGDKAEAGSEEEMPGDTSEEQLGNTIDLGQVLVESLALAVPLYPRAEGVEMEQAVFAAPGIAPMHDEDARPFAGLAALRGKLEKAGEKDDGENGEDT